MMHNPSLPLYWKMPLVGGGDQAIDLAAREYIAAKHGVYTLGALLEYLRWRVPRLRIQIAVAAAAKRKQAHNDAVRELIEPRIAA